MVLHRRHKVVENIIAPIFGVLVFGTFTIWATVIDRIPPFVSSDPEVTPVAVRGGGTITVRWKATVLRERTYSQTCTREVIDSLKTFWRVDEQVLTSVSPPKDGYIARSINIPFEASWGRAYYRRSCCYKFDGITLTHLFPVCGPRPMIPFEILPTSKS